MKLIIIEGLDKTGKTTYTRNKYQEYKKIRLPGAFSYTQDIRKNFLEGNIHETESLHMIYGEHMAVLEHLQREINNYILDRSFVSFLAYQKETLQKYGYYEIYKQILENKFKQITEIYDTKILYFSKRLIERKDDWLERLDIDNLKNNFDSLLSENLYKKYVEHITIV